LYHNLAMVHQSEGQLREAERLYGEAIQRNPAQAQARYNLGALLLESKRWKDAVIVIEELVRLVPDYADAYVNLANAHIRLGNHRAAAQAYERFLQVHQKSDAIHDKVRQQLEVLHEGLEQNPD
jgi:protein O-GlcNAc transferase